MQEEVGLQSITDGEFRRGSWFFGFVQAVDGLTTKDSLFDFHDDAGGTRDVPDRLCRGQASAHARHHDRRVRVRARAITERTPKVTMPTPSLVHFFRLDQAVDRNVYPDMEEFWSDLIAVYREEIAALAALGCRYVQLDEVPIAMLCDPEHPRAGARRPASIRTRCSTPISAPSTTSSRNRPAGMTIALHLCKGNYKGHWMAEGGYEAVAEKLFNEADVDTFFLEYESERAGGFEPLRHVPNDKNVILGLDQQQDAAA